MLEVLLVGVIVLVAAAYATWALLPKTARLRLARALASAAEARWCPGWLRRPVLALHRRAHAGGGYCDDCGGAASIRREETRR
jgi:hypothetical protein